MKKVLIITAENFEDSELFVPYYRFLEEDMDVDIASLTKEKIVGKYGYSIYPNLTFDEVNPEDYDALILPGGKAPEKIRKEKKVLEIVKFFMQKKKPIAAICHGPQILISAEVMKGKKATCYSAVSEELKNSGAIYKDREVVVDENLITSRTPRDLPAFMRELIKKLRVS